VVAVTQLAGVPILLHFWGTQLYGEWLILFAIPAYLSMTDLGFSQSAANDMTQRVARGDHSGALHVFQSLVVLVLVSAIVGLLIVTGILNLVPLDAWLPFVAISGDAARWILWLLAAEVLVKLTEGVSHAGFRASGAYPLHTSIYYTTLFLQHAGIWLLATLGFGPIAAATVFLVVRAVVTPAVAVLLVRRHSWLRYGLANARVSELRRLAKPAMANIGFPLAQALNIQGMVLVVGAVLGPLAVVTFSALRTLTRLALQAVLTVSHAAEPELALAYGAGDHALLRRLYIQVVRAGLWLALAVAVALSLGGNWVVATWTHGKVAMNSSLFHWLLATAVAGGLWYSGLIVLKAGNLHIRAACIYALSAGLAVTLAYAAMAMTQRLETAGMTLLLIDAAMAAYTLRAAARVCRESLWRLLSSAVNPMPLILLAWKRAHVL
jgi:O-antigen/teichoic acid export membrane protein